MQEQKDLKINMEVNGKIIYELSPTITQKSIIDTVQLVKQKLIEYEIDKNKMLDVYDISIEILQNILKYSYGNIIKEDNTRKADGIFNLTYDTNTKEIIINGYNLVVQDQIEILKQRYEEIKHLDKKGLRKLLREKARSRKDGHKDGAGLGLATIASKAQSISIDFESVLPNVYKYMLEVKI